MSNSIWIEDQLGSTSDVKSGLVKTLDMLQKMNIKIVLIDQMPKYNVDVPSYLAKTLALAKLDQLTGYERKLSEPEGTPYWMGKLIEQQKDNLAAILRPRDVICANNRCRLEHKGLSLYKDKGHIANKASVLFVPMFEKAIQRIFLTGK